VSWIVSLVEDDEDIREHLAEVMRARGLQVVEARNGAEVLDLVRRRGIRPALLVLDLMMPVMDGWALLAAQASEPMIDGVPVIVITAYELQGPFPATVQAVFRKPFPLASLLDTIRHVTSSIEPPRRPLARGSEGLPAPLVPPKAGDDPEET
jgi:CheY-like chemotaxis protein